ncbi:AAA family ATPase [Mobilitalea sibirica]|uniref:AAA family ATPase n=1 Tax=Mobilitalea sibirica TaxID=1462919 RepID=A0A8J7L2K9_9FIRM|nr:AAA family ATPase [Mobilitalea sibirica]MBH1940853.1 AAA family ATPase [Mobilitalea sibirica]
MIQKIHILGASGSGTTTLGEELSKKLGYQHIDTDNYFWVPTDPPFQVKRDTKDRQELLMKELKNHSNWILTGSLCGWGDIFIPMFDLVVYLWIPADLRLNRLHVREAKRYGKDAVMEGGCHYEKTKVFLDWASKYDTGGMEVRSRVLHDHWLQSLTCPVIRLEGDLTVEDRVRKVEDFISKNN